MELSAWLGRLHLLRPMNKGPPPPSLGDVGTPAAVKQGPDSCLLPSLKRRWGEGSAWLVCEKEMPARGGL